MSSSTQCIFVGSSNSQSTAQQLFCLDVPNSCNASSRPAGLLVELEQIKGRPTVALSRTLRQVCPAGHLDHQATIHTLQTFAKKHARRHGSLFDPEKALTWPWDKLRRVVLVEYRSTSFPMRINKCPRTIEILMIPHTIMQTEQMGRNAWQGCSSTKRETVTARQGPVAPAAISKRIDPHELMISTTA